VVLNCVLTEHLATINARKLHSMIINGKIGIDLTCEMNNNWLWVWNWMIRTLVAEHDRKWLSNLGFLRLSPQSSHWNQTMTVLVALISTEKMGVSVLQLAGVNLIWGLRLGDYHRPQEWIARVFRCPFHFYRCSTNLPREPKIRNIYFSFSFLFWLKKFIFK
jgi:hypothetical protein